MPVGPLRGANPEILDGGVMTMTPTMAGGTDSHK